MLTEAKALISINSKCWVFFSILNLLLLLGILKSFVRLKYVVGKPLYLFLVFCWIKIINELYLFYSNHLLQKPQVDL